MTERFPSLEPGRATNPDRVFVSDERHLRECSARHLAAAMVLAAGDVSVVADADFLAMLAAECLLKHLFCLVRYSKGFAGPNADSDFGSLKLALSLNHDVKTIGSVLIRSAEDLRTYEPLQELMVELPAGRDWNEDRYKARKATETWRMNVKRKIVLIQRIMSDVSGALNAD